MCLLCCLPAPALADAPAALEPAPELARVLTGEQKAWLARHPILTFGVGTNFVPLMFVRDGQAQGMALDYVELVCRKLGVTPRYVWSDTFEHTLDLGRRGQVDVFPCVEITPSRDDFLDYSRTFLSFPLVIFTRSDAPFIAGVEDLNNKKMAVVPALATYARLKEKHPLIQYHVVTSIPQALEAVSLGRADAYILNLAVGTYYIQQLGFTNLKVAAPTYFQQNEMHMGVRRDLGLLRGAIDQALASISPQEHAEIRQRWLALRFEYGISPLDMALVALAVATGALLVVGAVWAWNRRLQREVARRRQAERDLRHSEAKYRTLFERSNEAVALMTDRFVDCNPAASRILKMSREDIVGHSPAQLSPLVQPDGQDSKVKHDQILARVLGGEAIEYHWTFLDGQGQQVEMEIMAQAVPLADGPMVLTSGRDVTEKKRAQKEKERLEQQLRQSHKMQTIGTLAGGIAHDFNNILAAIMSYCELAERKMGPQGAGRAELTKVIAAAERARDLVLQILTFSRQREPRLSPMDLNQQVRATALLLERTIPKMVRLELELDPELPQIMGDPVQLEQVLMNLASNAADAMPQGGRLRLTTGRQTLDASAPQSALAGQELGDYVRLTVSDDGHGMPPELLTRIFDPFFTTKEVGRGTGLGLSTAMGVIKGHGGRIVCQSNPGEGATFEVLIPAMARAPRALACPRPEAEDLRGRGERVLLVDDEPDLLHSGNAILEEMGYRVSTALSGEDALAVLAREELDLVLMDLNMPGMGGKAALTRMRGLRPELPVVIASGYADLARKQEVLALGAVGYLHKPYRLRELLAMARRVLAAGGSGQIEQVAQHDPEVTKAAG